MQIKIKKKTNILISEGTFPLISRLGGGGGDTSPVDETMSRATRRCPEQFPFFYTARNLPGQTSGTMYEGEV